MPGCAEKLSQSAKGQDNGLGGLFAVTEKLGTFDQVASPLCAKSVKHTYTHTHQRTILWEKTRITLKFPIQTLPCHKLFILLSP